MYRKGLLLSTQAELRSCTENTRPLKLKTLTAWPFVEKVCWPLQQIITAPHFARPERNEPKDKTNARGTNDHKYLPYAFFPKFLKWTYIACVILKGNFYSIFARPPPTSLGAPDQTQGPTGPG